jgi:hypothetical protein
MLEVVVFVPSLGSVIDGFRAVRCECLAYAGMRVLDLMLC